jgi:phospholipase/carboxylesterase
VVAWRTVTGPAPRLDYELATRSGAQDRLLVLLHGYGEPASSLLDRVDQLDPQARFLAVAPTAPFDKDGRPVWHRAMGGDSELAMTQLLQSLAAIDRFVDQIAAETGLERERAVVGGFSQGGGLAYALLLAASAAPPPAAAFGICSFPPPIPDYGIDPARVVGHPVFLTGALRDRFAPIDMSREAAVVLADLGLAVSYHETDSEHVLTDEAWLLAAQWLDEVCEGRPPTTALPVVGDTSAHYVRSYRVVDGSPAAETGATQPAP